MYTTHLTNKMILNIFSRPLVVAFMSFFLFGCSSLIGVSTNNCAVAFSANLSNVYLNGENKSQYISDMYFEDENIAIKWSKGYSQMTMIIQNKSAMNLAIDWNKSAWVNVDNTSEMFIHSGVKYVDRSSVKAPSIIPSGSRITECIIPNSLIYYDKYLGWKENYLLCWTTEELDDAKKISKLYDNKKVRAVLSFVMGANDFEYDFEFNLTDPKIASKGKIIQ
nr:hypothetical protein [uncultured Macellibacteroides sp.]